MSPVSRGRGADTPCPFPFRSRSGEGQNLRKKGNTMVILNENTENEISLRVVLESERYGREYFDHADDIKELLDIVERLVKDCLEAAGDDHIERTVAIAIVPKSNYGDECGYGFDL